MIARLDFVLDNLLELESLNYEIGQEDAINSPCQHKIGRRELLREQITSKLITVIRQLNLQKIKD